MRHWDDCGDGPHLRTILVDWLGVTFTTAESPQEILTLFGPTAGWRPRGGGYGYRKSYHRGGLRIYSDGSEGMGVHVVIQGPGCRQLEAEGLVTDWTEYLRLLLSHGGRFTRLDFALDDRAGLLPFSEVLGCAERGDFSAFYRVSEQVRSHERRGRRGVPQGRSVYFGSCHSETGVVIYDKGAQQGVPEPWVRVEVRFRKGSAEKIVEAVLEGGPGRVVEWLRGHLDFKVSGAGTPSGRATCSWWRAFLGDGGRCRFGRDPRTRNTEASLDRMLGQYQFILTDFVQEHGWPALILRVKGAVAQVEASR